MYEGNPKRLCGDRQLFKCLPSNEQDGIVEDDHLNSRPLLPTTIPSLKFKVMQEHWISLAGTESCREMVGFMFR